MKITKEEFESLSSNDITKIQYDLIILKITKRVEYIIRHISTTFYWWAFGNADYYAEGDPGFFDVKDYKEYITVIGEFELKPPYNTCPEIPTRWLWEDFEQEFQREFDNYNKEEEERKIKLNTLEQSIRSKLTEEELKAISFKK